MDELEQMEQDTQQDPTAAELADELEQIDRNRKRGRPNKAKDTSAATTAYKAKLAATQAGWEFDQTFLPRLEQLKRDNPCTVFSPMWDFLALGESILRGIAYRRTSLQHMSAEEAQRALDENSERPFVRPQGANPSTKTQQYMPCFLDAGVMTMIRIARYKHELSPELVELLADTIRRTLKWATGQQKIAEENKTVFTFSSDEQASAHFHFRDEMEETLRDIEVGKKLYVGPVVIERKRGPGRPKAAEATAPQSVEEPVAMNVRLETQQLEESKEENHV